MPGARRLSGFARVQLPADFHIDGQGETFTNPSDQALTIPSTASIVTIGAENGDCYYDVNGGIAGVNSPGFVPPDTVRRIGPIANLTTMRVHAPSAVIHVDYWREA